VPYLWLRDISSELIKFFFPARCIGCGKWGDFLCQRCVKKLPRISPPICLKCGKPETSGSYCAACWGTTTSIDGIRSVFHFEGVIRKAIHELKYYHLKAISACMTQFLYNFLQENPVPGDLIIPVPIHKNRIKQRGYNQSSLISAELGKLIGIPVVENCLVRARDTYPQVRSLNLDQRRKNVHNAFTCNSGTYDGKKVILIDDVCTSGATLEACAVALKKGGFESVWGVTIAREI